MNIIQMVRGVEKLFESLDKDIKNLQNQTNIHCIESCIRCCTTPKIQATSIEFLPLVYHLYKAGKIGELIEKLDAQNNEYACPVLNILSTDGQRQGCTYYPYRGLICRLFSYNYITDKNGVKKINACKTIHINQSKQVEMANSLLKNETICPKASDYYSKLSFINHEAAHQIYPIGKAIRVAIDMVIIDFRYRGKKIM